MSKNSDFTPPQDPVERKRLKNMLIEISAQQQMMADRREAIKEIKEDIKESFKMPPSLLTKLVKAIDDSTYVEMTTENSIFELTRETILGDAGLPDDNA